MVTLKANNNEHFTSWSITSGSGVVLDDENAIETTFIMPDSDVTIKAVFGVHDYVGGKCTLCGAKDLDYKYEITAKGESAKTGDNSNMMLWIVMLFVSVSILGIVVYGKRKNI